MLLRLAFVLLSLTLLAAACGGGGSSSSGPSTTPTTSVRITSKDRLFDKKEIKVPANAHVTVELDNEDADPHNFAVYETRAAEEEVFVSDTISGRGTTTTGEFDSPGPGKYFFRCDVHPVTMTGDLIVE